MNTWRRRGKTVEITGREKIWMSAKRKDTGCSLLLTWTETEEAKSQGGNIHNLQIYTRQTPLKDESERRKEMKIFFFFSEFPRAKESSWGRKELSETWRYWKQRSGPLFKMAMWNKIILTLQGQTNKQQKALALGTIKAYSEGRGRVFKRFTVLTW